MGNNLAIARKSDLRSQHQDLYRLIVDKLEKDERLTLTEAKEIWLQIPTSLYKDGVPHRAEYQYGGDGFYARVEVPMTADEVVERVLKWLTQSIGLLVVRGYLKVTPMLDVRQLPSPETDDAVTDLAAPGSKPTKAHTKSAQLTEATQERKEA